MATGKKLRVLTVVDTFSRYVPVLDAKFSYRGEDVVATLDRICRQTGYPKTIRVDQGSEFISRDMDLWAYQRGVILDFSRPGKPTDNAFIEAFNGRFRAECLNQHWFLTLCGRGRKVGGLAQILQRGTATRRDRQQGPDHADEIGGRHQPVTLNEAGKLCLRAVQGWGSDQYLSISSSLRTIVRQ